MSGVYTPKTRLCQGISGCLSLSENPFDPLGLAGKIYMKEPGSSLSFFHHSLWTGRSEIPGQTMTVNEGNIMMNEQSNPLCDEKTAVLKAKLKALKTAVVAFSGGVDSTFLLAVAAESGLEKLLAVTVDSAFVTREEIRRAQQTARDLGVVHQVLQADILGHETVVENTLERCYHCKTAVFSLIQQAADQAGTPHVLHGVNTDDLGDFRPGLKATEALGVMAPLVDAGFSKPQIRACSRQMGLAVWNLPSQSCLATRIPFFDAITKDALERIEQAEQFIRSLGFAHVRVRCHGTVARIETDAAAIGAMVEHRKQISASLKSFGFTFVSLDLDGYQTGKMNPA
jgi:pyridinium-3,5-biscarboxylic acid mononucleotide sulfurtransferase